ncbi:Bug family tripartite tricarboxylate transporter substrate binding protein [Ramlibacter sp. MMS24-I3-19]|uniref:Bug family tripartite tricarboxylate transporter substrate binding protein n=1 Tax=Ramlibacter sp. MMS24-I3-19 TaxID=3416606 RepID=UPI003CFE2C9D
MTTRRTVLLATAAAAVVPAWAQAHYPSRPIRLVVPFPAGGATDIFARAVSQKLGEHLGGTIVVDNKPGAGGAIGSDIAAKAPADGYTLLLATSSTHAIGPSYPNAKLPYDVVNDFTPIGHVGNAPNLMIVPKTSPANSVKEWIDYARKNPGKLNYASSGNGTIVQLSAEYFQAQTGVQLVHIPYRGTALAMPDLISGKIDLLFDNVASAMPHLKDGRVKALGISSAKRSPLFPELPTINETVPGYDVDTWFGLYGPKGLPADMVTRLNKAMNQALVEADVKDRLARLGIVPAGGTPQQFAEMTNADRAKWKKIIAERKLTLD